MTNNKLQDDAAGDLTEQQKSSAYKLAYTDIDFLKKEELISYRMQLELLKPELTLQSLGIESTIVVFGSARILPEDVAREKLAKAEQSLQASPNDKLAQAAVVHAKRQVSTAHYYQDARELAQLISKNLTDKDGGQSVIVTGGGPGIMGAANHGAHDVGARSIGLTIVLPKEEAPNEYITPELTFRFQYFAMRKIHFLMRAKALIAFPGGFGTMDELFETLTLIQTKKIDPMPILLFGRSFWDNVVNFDYLCEQGMISPEDLLLFNKVDTVDEAYTQLRQFYQK